MVIIGENRKTGLSSNICKHTIARYANPALLVRKKGAPISNFNIFGLQNNKKYIHIFKLPVVNNCRSI